MKKKLLAMIAIVCAAVFVLAACGGGGGKAPAGSGSGSTPAPAGGTSSSGETYDVGDFTITVPAGWTTFPQSDLFAEKDAEGNSPVDPTQIMVAKGSFDSEFAAYSAPFVRIYANSPDSFTIEPTDLYDDVKDLSGVTVQGKECKGYEYDSAGYYYQELFYETDAARYDIVILKSVEGKDTGISVEDADVKTIMESITAK